MAMGCLKFPTFLCQAVRAGVASKSPRASLVINTSFSRCVAHSRALRSQNGRGPFLAKICRPTIATKRHGFCNRATRVSDAGSVDSSLMESMQNKIKEQLNAEVVVVKDAYGDGRHVMIEVVSSAFEGQSQVNRQRMVYKAIWEELQSAVHAVDYMVTKTPSEASQ